MIFYKYSLTKYTSILRIETVCVRSDFNLVLTSRELQVYSIEKQWVKFPPKQSMNINYHDVIRFKTGEFSESRSRLYMQRTDTPSHVDFAKMLSFSIYTYVAHHHVP